MRNYYYNLVEAYNNVQRNMNEALAQSDAYSVNSCKDTMKTWPKKALETGEHTKIETIKGHSVRILGYKEDMTDDYPVIALVKEDEKEILFEYDTFGNRRLEDGTTASGEDCYRLCIHNFYFENGDYVASKSFIGILESAPHSKYKFSKDIETGEELYGWFRDAPIRLCTQEEIDLINKCFDETKVTH